jgi:hypothetical protein
MNLLKEKFKEHWCIIKNKNSKALLAIPADLSAHLSEISTLAKYLVYVL